MTDPLLALAALAREADLHPAAADAEAVAHRLAAGRFFVACTGQFKRGKSSVLNALVGRNVLPVGVTPVTAAVTVLRHGSTPGAVVHFLSGSSEPVPLESINLYVTEEHNHENRRGVAALEVFLPAPILASGLCLVDTPGIGSTFEANTAVTRAFVPQVDAALVVLGADPPISGEELALIGDMLAQVPDPIFVMNKADRLPADDVRQARVFTQTVLTERLGRAVGPVLEVSATERASRDAPTRHWAELEAALKGLTRHAGEIVERSRGRALTRIARQVHSDLEERAGAIRRPLQESETRIERLRRSVADAETLLHELGTLLAAEQSPLLRAFEQRQERFVETEAVQLVHDLGEWVAQLSTGGLGDRARAFSHASEVAHDAIDRWLLRLEPEADKLYRNATRRFVALANDFLARLAESGDPAFAGLPRIVEAEPGLRESRKFYTTDLMHLTSPGVVDLVASVVLPRRARLTRVRRRSVAYLERLLRSNTTRVVFDLDQRVERSRHQLEAELRQVLRSIAGSAERALERARATQAAGRDALAAEAQTVRDLSDRLAAIVTSESSGHE